MYKIKSSIIWKYLRNVFKWKKDLLKFIKHVKWVLMVNNKTADFAERVIDTMLLLIHILCNNRV